jgi:hypothetical protein
MEQATFVANDSVTSQPNLTTQSFVPALQREDGSYIGTDINNQLDAVNLDGTSPWQTKINPDADGNATSVAPLYATADAGVVATSSRIDGNGDTQLGNLFTVNSAGTVTGQQPDTASRLSWRGKQYSATTMLTQVAYSSIGLAGTFAAIKEGNHSFSNASIQQVQTNKTQADDEQVPDPDSQTNSNYNSIELLTSSSPDEIFSKYLRTFKGAQSPNNSIVNALVTTQTGTVTQVGQMLEFVLQGVSAMGQGPFSVRVKRFNSTTRTISVVTLKGHPLAGWRYWRVFPVESGPATPYHLVIETGAVDVPGPGLKNYIGFYLTKADQLQCWEDYLSFIKRDTQAQQLKMFSNFNIVRGKWGFDKTYILNNLCTSASACQ